MYSISSLTLKRLPVFHFADKSEFENLVGKATKTHFTYFIFTSTTFILSEYESLQEFWHTWFYFKSTKSIKNPLLMFLNTFYSIKHLSFQGYNPYYMNTQANISIEYPFGIKQYAHNSSDIIYKLNDRWLMIKHCVLSKRIKCLLQY